MFGHDDNTKNDNQDMDSMVTDEVVQEAAAANDEAVSPAYTPAPPAPGVVTPAADDDNTAEPSSEAAPAAAEETSEAPAGDVPPVTPAYEAPEAANDEAAAPAAADTTSTDGLLGIKQDALQQLSPLVGHLNQTPEEKFRTTMMMIQASDNQALIKDAYAAAQAITDDKTRAQALLDIINEINYFTRQS